MVVAYASGDANMISAVERGIDVHTHTASLMFHADPDIIKMENKIVGHSTDADYIRELRQEQLSEFYDARWPRTMSLRQCGKKSNHGLNYDEGANGFALINEIEIPEARRIVALYHQIYPESGFGTKASSVIYNETERSLTVSVAALDLWDSGETNCGSLLTP